MTEKVRLLVYLGAGSDRIPNFTHLDNNIRKQSKKGVKVRPPEILCDLRDKLPFKKETVDLFYTIHTLEHLTHRELMACLTDLLITLKIGGFLRVVVPCFDCMIQSYLQSQEVIVENWEVNPDLPIRNPSELFAARALYHDHKYLHNFETLSQALQDVGFQEIKACSAGQTDFNSIVIQQVFWSKESARTSGDLILEAKKTNRLELTDNSWRKKQRRLYQFLAVFLNLKLGRNRGLVPAFPEVDWFREKKQKLKRQRYTYFEGD